MKGYITDVAAIAGLANRELGSEVALTLLVIFAVNIIIARLTPVSYTHLDVYKRQPSGCMINGPTSLPGAAAL